MYSYKSIASIVLAYAVGVSFLFILAMFLLMTALLAASLIIWNWLPTFVLVFLVMRISLAIGLVGMLIIAASSWDEFTDLAYSVETDLFN